MPSSRTVVAAALAVLVLAGLAVGVASAQLATAEDRTVSLDYQRVNEGTVGFQFALEGGSGTTELRFLATDTAPTSAADGRLVHTTAVTSPASGDFAAEFAAVDNSTVWALARGEGGDWAIAGQVAVGDQKDEVPGPITSFSDLQLPGWLSWLEGFVDVLQDAQWLLKNPARAVAAILVAPVTALANATASLVFAGFRAVAGGLEATGTALGAAAGPLVDAAVGALTGFNRAVGEAVAGTGPLGQAVAAGLVAVETVALLEGLRRLAAAVPVVGGVLTG